MSIGLEMPLDIVPVWAAAPKNYTGAAMTAKYVSLKNYQRVFFVIQTGAWAGGTGAVTINEATDVSASDAQALSFSYQWNDVSTSGTMVRTAVTADTFNVGTANKIWIIPVEASMLSSGYDCVTLAIASPGANNDYYGVTYFMAGARYPQKTGATFLTD